MRRFLFMIPLVIASCKDNPRSAIPKDTTVKNEFLDLAVAQRNFLVAKAQYDQAMLAMNDAASKAQEVCAKDKTTLDANTLKCVPGPSGKK